VLDTTVIRVAAPIKLVVDLADLAVSRDPYTTLITHSLGSCIAVAIWDPVGKVAGLLHYMLPESSRLPEKAECNPAMFCDSGVRALFDAACRLGAVRRRLVVRVAGGSHLFGDKGTFDIGKRNYAALRKAFSENGIMINAEHVGGTISRTMRVEAGTGAVIVKFRGGEVSL
jgi:chemotaxis protein CheD